MRVQLIIMGIYLIVAVILGILSGRKADDSREFMGANIGILFCVAASAGEWLGGTSTTGIAEYGYIYGISGAWFTLANGMGIIVLTIGFARLYRSLGKITVPGIVSKYLGEKAGMTASILLLIVMIVIECTQMVAMGTLGESLLGIDKTLAIFVLGTGIVVSTCFGGMMAVGYTNSLHMFTMYIGIGIALITTLVNVGGFQGLQTSLCESYFNFTAIGKEKVFSWIIASVLGACTAQAGIQPILAAKNEKTAVRSSFLTALVVAPFGILTAMLGMISRVRFPELTDSKQALFQLILSLNPIISGLVLAAVLAAVLSTSAPVLLASATLFTNDIYGYFKRNVSEKERFRISKLSTLLVGIICMALAVLLYNGTLLLDILYFAYSIRGSIFVILVLGIYWKRINPSAAIVGMLTAAFTGTFWVIFQRITGTYPICSVFTETYASIVAALGTTVVFSLMTKKKK